MFVFGSSQFSAAAAAAALESSTHFLALINM